MKPVGFNTANNRIYLKRDGTNYPDDITFFQNLNADLLDGKHANEFALQNDLSGYLLKNKAEFELIKQGRATSEIDLTDIVPVPDKLQIYYIEMFCLIVAGAVYGDWDLRINNGTAYNNSFAFADFGWGYDNGSSNWGAEHNDNYNGYVIMRGLTKHTFTYFILYGNNANSGFTKAVSIQTENKAGTILVRWGEWISKAKTDITINNLGKIVKVNGTNTTWLYRIFRWIEP